MSTSLKVDLSKDSVPTVSTEFKIQGQIVLILCGLIASGKSTFAEALQHHYPQFRRCNQDDLGDRHIVEQLARKMLNEGYSVCIDRTNFNAAQRSHWIEIAREFPGTVVWVIVFDTPYEICATRLQTRSSHPTIKSPQQGLSVLSRFAADFRQPIPEEGYQRILSVKPSDHMSPIYSRSDIAVILRRIQNSPTVTSDEDLKSGLSGSSFQGNTNRGRHVWGEPYARVPIVNAEPSNAFRNGERAPYRGNSVGLQVARGFRFRPYEILQNQSNSSEVARQGSKQNPFVID